MRQSTWTAEIGTVMRRDGQYLLHCPWNTIVPSPSPWPDKVMAVLRSGNPAAAIAQIKVAPSVRDLRALEKALVSAKLGGKWRDVDIAITESLDALSAPRLHRSP